MPAAPVECADALLQPEQGAFDFAVPEPLSCCRQLQAPARGHAGQWDVRNDWLGGDIATNYLRRRGPVGLQRRQLRAALQHVLLPVYGCELPEPRAKEEGRYLRATLFRRP